MNKDIFVKALNLRHKLHKYPELSGQERETKKRIRGFLQENTNLEVVDRGDWIYAKYTAQKQLAKSIAFRADFDAIKDLSAESFVSEILCAQLSCRCALCGYNFRFGKYAAGSSDTLGQLLQAHGADTVVLPAVKSQGEDVSSTRIRALIQCGRIEDANDLLCKPFSVTGTVSKGRQIGRTLGFPTANLPFPMGKLIPRNGVYYCHVKTRLGIFGAVANIGIHPTFDDQPERPVLEAHLLSFDGDLYGEEVQVSLLRFLREEKKFSDPAVLAATVHADMHTAMQLAATDPILMKGSS